MAANLINAGYSLMVFDIDQKHADSLIAYGAKKALRKACFTISGR